MRLTLANERFGGSKRRRKRQGEGKKKSNVGWKPLEEEEYQEKMREALSCEAAKAGAKPQDSCRECKAIEEIVVKAAEECKTNEASNRSRKKEVKAEIVSLMEQRREMRAEGVKGEAIGNISKQIQRSIHRQTRKETQERIGRILGDFNGLKQIAGIRGDGRKKGVTKMKDQAGKEVFKKKEIPTCSQNFTKSCTRAR